MVLKLCPVQLAEIFIVPLWQPADCIFSLMTNGGRVLILIIAIEEDRRVNKENVWIILLLYIFTPEDSSTGLMQSDHSAHNKMLFYSKNAKSLIWIVLSILSGLFLGQL